MPVECAQLVDGNARFLELGDDLLDEVVGGDPLVCPVLATMFPPEGDIPGVWDCPPYG